MIKAMLAATLGAGLLLALPVAANDTGTPTKQSLSEVLEGAFKSVDSSSPYGSKATFARR